MNRKLSILLVPLAFAAGGIAGAWKPLEEVKALEYRLAHPPEDRKPSDGFGAFARMVNIPDAARHPRRARSERSPRPAETGAGEAKSAAAEPEVRPTAAPATPQRGRRLSPDDLRARIDEARDAWAVRVEVAKAATCSKLALDAAGKAAFETAVANMNAKLLDSFETMAELIRDRDSMTPELGARLMGDLATTLAETYDEIGQAADPAVREEVARTELWNFIDPGVAEPFVEVQSKLSGAGLPGGLVR